MSEQLKSPHPALAEMPALLQAAAGRGPLRRVIVTIGSN